MTFTFGLLAIALLIATRQRAVRLLAGAALIVVVFAQTGLMLRGYNPTVTANDFYPTTSAMQTIRSTVGGTRKRSRRGSQTCTPQ